MIIVGALGHLSCKSNAQQVIKSFVTLVENKLSGHIKNIESKNCVEFLNTKVNQIFQSKGIIPQKSFLYTP